MIDRFDGDHRFLSNFWPARVSLDGEFYPSVEHAYQAAKSLDIPTRLVLCSRAANPLTAGQAKTYGKRIQLRLDWENVRLAIMEGLVRQKFSVEPLKSKLLGTLNCELLEGNFWGDRFWGIDLQGRGENHLGKILMKIRKELQDAEAGVSVSRG